ncbi:hypothetical protein AB0I54_44675 [Streptomyces sp. NPDC050625]|uniref:hypothetical protein n=1 Tax=Streptomyces sp. NPDC050625 TaxID=3154629 RepID=UPI0034365F7E
MATIRIQGDARAEVIELLKKIRDRVERPAGLESEGTRMTSGIPASGMRSSLRQRLEKRAGAIRAEANRFRETEEACSVTLVKRTVKWHGLPRSWSSRRPVIEVEDRACQRIADTTRS